MVSLCESSGFVLRGWTDSLRHFYVIILDSFPQKQFFVAVFND